MTTSDIEPTSYFSVSVDAGSREVYNSVHAVRNRGARLFDKVLRNLKSISSARDANQSPLDLSVTYLITKSNHNTDEITRSIEEIRATGIDLLRFSFPQVPRGSQGALDQIIPTKEEVSELVKRIGPIVEREASEELEIQVMDLDETYEIGGWRTLPCIARFIYPAIGFDGYLAHCSQSGAPHFRNMVLGNLETNDFWDLYYNYDVGDFWHFMESAYEKMKNNDCRCDRKEHAVNSLLRNARVWEGPKRTK